MSAGKFLSVPGSPGVGVFVRCIGTIIAVCSMAMIVLLLLLLPIGLLAATDEGSLGAVLGAAAFFLFAGSISYGGFRFGVALRSGGITTAHRAVAVGGVAFLVALASALARNWSMALVGGFLFIALAPAFLSACVGDDGQPAPSDTEGAEDRPDTGQEAQEP